MVDVVVISAELTQGQCPLLCAGPVHPRRDEVFQP